LKLASLLGKDFGAYEKVLGPPAAVEKTRTSTM
jgi:hypothetical protein